MNSSMIPPSWVPVLAGRCGEISTLGSYHIWTSWFYLPPIVAGSANGALGHQPGKHNRPAAPTAHWQTGSLRFHP
ncbi:hypothetical protein HMPREF1531_00392 [Propionibacterium sp. oral taxon 192 str. F0372]|nr:hypothetical protein HMPREF1531_00392 [Propionibacterium sp. oral taxon 192 str. F0372]